jgi:uncharacterized protein YbjT (DUF2867 family)
MKVIVTGATGMVGKGVLLECLEDERIEEVLSISRRRVEIQHPKLKELLHQDFTNFDSIREQLAGYDACFHCMGVSAVGKTEEEYTQLTYTVTKSLVDVCYFNNSAFVFNYVSGTGTDTREKSRQMWARVKGKTENYVLDKGFAKAWMFRPGFIIPEKGIQSSTSWYNTIYKILKPFFGWSKKMNSVTTTTKIGKAMINSVFTEERDVYLYNPNINELAAATV